MVDVIIVGGGASGLVCGIEAARRGKRCLILEQKEKAGKKLYATGNGKCNFANRNVDLSCYHSVQENKEQGISQVITAESCASVEDFFLELGIPAVERQGYLYPRSEQAGTLVQALEQAFLEYQGQIHCGESVQSIHWQKDGSVKVTTKEQTYEGKQVVLATGGAAAPNLGSDGSGYALASKMGHTVTTYVPALCGLKCKEKGWNRLQGVRAKGSVALWLGDRLISKDRGEIQFTKYGVSGIVIFNLSRYAGLGLKEGKQLRLAMDLFPEYMEEQLLNLLKELQARCGYRSLLSVWSGFLPEKLAAYLLERLEISESLPLENATSEQLANLVDIGKDCSITITGTNDFLEAQVTAGGVPLQEVQLDSMESKVQPGCFLVGELLDVDGCCGGYNLMWAWETGRRAGKQI